MPFHLPPFSFLFAVDPRREIDKIQKLIQHISPYDFSLSISSFYTENHKSPSPINNETKTLQLRCLSFHSIALFFISFPSSFSINFLTRSSISSPFASLLISIPMSHSLQANQHFVYFSVKKGQRNSGTPVATLSIIEFHPI
ncbi:hypothetical protein MANES_04G106150v8 [Manihot esculenta]|uniref:Uncharacterized protein n=1 Tax=Manihot esculenta TaxID=3983 RepID=A0ACB7HUK1_MANES|nr:hypothetical protein MANES_04G106150v8 [Manihot esculenta]